MTAARTYLLFSYSQYPLAIETSYISHISTVESKDKNALIYTLNSLFQDKNTLTDHENQKLIHLKTGEIIQIDDPEDIIDIPLPMIFSVPKEIRDMRNSQAVCNLIILQNETLIAAVDPTILIQESTSPKEAV